MSDVGAPSIADCVAERLARLLGPHTGRVAVKVFSRRALGRGPETLTRADLAALAEALRPMLRTLVGTQKAEVVVQQILREAGP